MSLSTNKHKLVIQSVNGCVHHPVLKPQKVYRVGSDGRAYFGPAHGGITYNFAIGDNCMRMVGDHIEPGVSSKNPNELENRAYTHLACVGNVAEIVTGKAAGDKGYITGKHGGIDHVMIWFAPETLDKMQNDDRIHVRACGQGLALDDYPQVSFMSMDPNLFEKMGIREEDGKLSVPVSAIIPAQLMGSGLGAMEVYGSDYDIMTRDPATYESCGLANLRFGDIIYIDGHHTFNGPDYLQGAGTIGVISHGDSILSGHGPGVTALISCKDGTLVPRLDSGANLAYYFGVKQDDK